MVPVELPNRRPRPQLEGELGPSVGEPARRDAQHDRCGGGGSRLGDRERVARDPVRGFGAGRQVTLARQAVFLPAAVGATLLERELDTSIGMRLQRDAQFELSGLGRQAERRTRVPATRIGVSGQFASPQELGVAPASIGRSGPETELQPAVRGGADRVRT